ncbi:MAG TPA: diacylglycerol kinase family protein [Gaiellaceae bacterium]|nr:diacylglycerol kinase family protein [Gaiellaceae bacterium]
MKRAFLIVNPYSTNVTGDRVAQVEDALRAHVELQTEFTRRPLHATELAEQHSRDADGIVVFSGDGTYNEALNGVYGEAPVGFLPGGGTSVLPRALGLPRDPVAAAHAVGAALAEGRTRSISLGCVNGRRFSFSAGVGFDGEAIRRINELGREPGGARPGDLQFVKTFARMVAERRGRWEPRLEVEGFGRAAFVLVANCDPYTYAGSVPLHVAPAARFELGLDFIAPTRVRPLDVPRLALYLVRGRGQLEAREVLSGHDLDRFVVRCDQPLPLQSDGEDLGDGDEFVFEANRAAVSVLV